MALSTTRRSVSLLVIGALFGIPLLGATTHASEAAGPVGAFLFSYDVRPGMGREFEAGYVRHLQWHRRANDPWRWWGWYVLAGDHPGRFVDGTFGLRFSEFDQRVDPAGDAADGAVNVMPFVDPVAREIWRRLPELGIGRSWEDLPPTRFVEVTTYLVDPGRAAEFEAEVAALRAAASPDGLSATWYELVVGGAEPAYRLMVPRAGFVELDRDPTQRTDFGGAVVSIRSELWLFRGDLSLLPWPAE